MTATKKHEQTYKGAMGDGMPLLSHGIPWYPHRAPLGHRGTSIGSLISIAPLATDWPSSSLFSTQKIRNLTHLRSLSTRPTCSVRNQTQDDSSKLLKGEGSTARICASVLNLATLPHLTHKISPATSRTPFHNHVQSSNMFKICPELSGVGARSLGSGT